jgi:hypothetical protein
MKSIVVGSVAAPHSTNVSTTMPKGAKAALRSVEALNTAKTEQEGSGTFQKAVAAAFLGFALVGASITPAHADTVNVAQPQASSIVETHFATGPPGLIYDAHTLDSQERFERFLNGPERTVAPQVDARSKAAFDQFSTRLTQILHQDAASLAWGHTPIRAGDPLSATQQDQVQKAFTDLIQELPVGAFGARFEHALEGVTGALGSDADLSTVRLKDLGRVGGDAAKEMLDELRRDSPTTFWSLASVAAAGAVALGYSEGTDALRDLGIRPEISTKLFDGVKLRVGVEAGPKFSDPAYTLGLSGNHTFDNGTVLRGGIQTRLHQGEFDQTRLTSSISTTGGFNAAGELTLGQDFKPEMARLSASQQFDRWHVGADTTYSFENDRFTSSLSAGRTFDINTRGDLDVQIRGSHDSHGQSFIGIGATFRW